MVVALLAGAVEYWAETAVATRAMAAKEKRILKIERGDWRIRCRLSE